MAALLIISAGKPILLWILCAVPIAASYHKSNTYSPTQPVCKLWSSILEAVPWKDLHAYFQYVANCFYGYVIGVPILKTVMVWSTCMHADWVCQMEYIPDPWWPSQHPLNDHSGYIAIFSKSFKKKKKNLNKNKNPVNTIMINFYIHRELSGA